LIKVLKKELFIYLAILVTLSLYMHPERIVLIKSPLQLGHTFVWSFGGYVVVAILRGVIAFAMKLFKRPKTEV